MQVTHVEDNITHAVFGQKSSIGFTMAETPEFFQVLSKSLYTDPKLAMCRETVCNAWDAHIAAGITDTPIEITLTQEKLIITDFGSGIPKDMIGEIYTVYGRSTKLNDGKQTGGFGLGCKSPFAYAEHFTVESSHGGIATTYALSCSSGESYGIPTLKEIVSLPAEVTGLSVTIPIHTSMQEIKQILEKVITNGNILAKLNGELVNRLEMPEGWAWSNHFNYRELFIRYGNVVYPVPTHPELQNAKGIINSIQKELRMTYALVLQAPANSISVAPSREALTLSDTTINTINILVGEFQAIYANCQANTLATHKVNIAQKTTVEDVILYAMQGAETQYPPDKIDTGAGLVKYMVEQLMHMRGKPVFKSVFHFALDKLQSMGHLDKFQYRTIKETPFPSDNYSMHHTLYRSYVSNGDGLIAPIQLFHKKLLSNVIKSDLVKIENLLRNCNIKDPTLRGITGKSFRAFPHEALMLSRKVIVITRAKSRINKQLENFKGESNLLKKAHLIYSVGTSKKEYADAIAFFTQQRYQIIDLVPAVSAPATRVSKKPAQPKRVGYINATAYVNFDTSAFNGSECKYDNSRGNAEYVKEPDWFIHAATTDGVCYFARYVKNYKQMFAGTTGAITLTSIKREQAIKAGIPTAEQYLLARCIKIVEDAPIEAVAIMQQIQLKAQLSGYVFDLLNKMPALAKHYGLVTFPQSELSIAILVLQAYRDCASLRFGDNTKINALLHGVVLSEKQKTLIKLVNTQFSNAIDWHRFYIQYRDGAELPKHVRKLIGIVLTQQEI